MERIIFHIDVNNAFLSWTAVDLLKQGLKIDIRNIPSIIAGDEKLRHGVVLAKSPVAKKMGIKTAETIYSARRKCHNLKIYPPNHSLYRRESDKLYHYLCQFSPLVERFSIDECFMDMTGMNLLYNDLVMLAYRMKDEIKNTFGFTVNIGIANNKFCAKMASDFEKPNKVHTLFMKEIEQKMWPLPVDDLFMVGKSSALKLHELHINTIYDLAHTDDRLLLKHFKSMGQLMKQHALGLDNSEVSPKSDKNKCISISNTLPKDVTDRQELKAVLLRQAEEVGRSLRKQHFYTKTIAITLKNANFNSYSHQTKLYNQTNSSTIIYNIVVDLLDKVWTGEAIRNIGIRLSDFTTNKERQISLFDQPKVEKEDDIQNVIDNINDKFGNSSIIPASLLKEKE